MSNRYVVDTLINSTVGTIDFAAMVGLKPQSIRKTYSQTGAALGIRPVKLPNGKLRWPTDAVAKLLAGGVK